MANAITEASEKMAALWQTARELEQEIAAADMDTAEGQRFLLRMLAQSVDTYVEYGDTERPTFHHAESAIRKMFADCPDTDYLRAPIALGPGRVYRLWGQIPKNALYVGVLLYGKGGRIGKRLTDEQLAVDDQGRFEIRIATDEQPGVWLPGDGDETAVLVRQYYSDRAVQAPLTVEIELLAEPSPPAPLDAGALAAGIERAERMLKAIVKRTKQALTMATGAAVNQFITIPGEQLFPTPDNKYCAAWYRMAKGGRVVIRGKLPTARYFSLALYNAWLESLDYCHHQVALNHEQLKTADDGSFEVVLSDQDPGAPNWLDTAGHSQGYILVRVLLLEGEMPEFGLEVQGA